ncbi:MAG: Radical domain protein, partial [Symbiobacteriaceae bacterium]|nr:Radical domain protein [Symbiobacteriaceae bacterium]
LQLWMPHRVLFEETALEYPLARAIRERLRGQAEIGYIKSHNRISGLPGNTPRQKYAEAKRTLVVGLRRTLKFETSKPSADYAIPLLTGCPGHCEYCYLQTTLGPRPVVRVYVNLDDIFNQARAYMREKAPGFTTFEGACTSDPLAVEHITGVMREAVTFFGSEELGRFRFVSKYGYVESLLDAPHNGHTRIRFSINTDQVLKKWELGTHQLSARVRAAAQLAGAGYPVGFILGPIFLEGSWQEEYQQLLDQIHAELAAHGVDRGHDMTFELITHRFTPKAKALIEERFPETDLPMEPEDRRWKYGQFGYGKYIYPKDPMEEAEEFFREALAEHFPEAEVPYFV